jgi:uncharacterized protein YqjF (DUF2071 family)
VQLAVTMRNLLVVSWEVDPERVRIDLPAGLAPALAGDGGGLVSLVAFVNEDVRLGDTPAPSFAQLNVRTYVSGDRGPGAYVLSFRVTPPGMGGAAFGAPYRPARIRVREGSVTARGLGVSVAYRRTGEPAEPLFRTGPDAAHEIGYFEAAGTRRFHAEHDPIAWERAELTGELRVDPVLALGFDLGEPLPAVFADSVSARFELPPEKVG